MNIEVSKQLQELNEMVTKSEKIGKRQFGYKNVRIETNRKNGK